MCELLGINFNLPVSPEISFKGFCLHGEKNPDGWGVAFYPDRAAQIIEEPLKAGESQLAAFLQNYRPLKSKIFIFHVRSASRGSVSYSNTHPFSRELKGKEYVFAHNGTLSNYRDKLKLERFEPVGNTDSEYAFCYLLDSIAKEGISNWGRGEA